MDSFGLYLYSPHLDNYSDNIYLFFSILHFVVLLTLFVSFLFRFVHSRRREKRLCSYQERSFTAQATCHQHQRSTWSLFICVFFFFNFTNKPSNYKYLWIYPKLILQNITAGKKIHCSWLARESHGIDSLVNGSS
jgi:hypothetical protein